MTKPIETMRVPVLADGKYAGARALKGFASTGLGSAFFLVQTRRENAVRVTTATIPADVFAVLDEHPDAMRRGLDGVAFAKARRSALKLMRGIESLDAEKTWASKSLFSKPEPREPQPLPELDQNDAEVFATLLAEVGRGRPSIDVLREIALGADERRGATAISMTRFTWPAIPDWYWHPGVAIPAWIVEQVAELRAGERARVTLTDDALDEARRELLNDRKLRGKARSVATAQLRQREIADRKR